MTFNFVVKDYKDALGIYRTAKFDVTLDYLYMEAIDEDTSEAYHDEDIFHIQRLAIDNDFYWYYEDFSLEDYQVEMLCDEYEHAGMFDIVRLFHDFCEQFTYNKVTLEHIYELYNNDTLLDMFREYINGIVGNPDDEIMEWVKATELAKHFRLGMVDSFYTYMAVEDLYTLEHWSGEFLEDNNVCDVFIIDSNDVNFLQEVTNNLATIYHCNELELNFWIITNEDSMVPVKKGSLK